MASFTWSFLVLFFIIDGIHLAVGCDCKCEYGLSQSCPGKSCLDIYHKNLESRGVSGEYIIKAGNDLHLQYCDMQLECGGEKGWMKIININVASGDSCPNGWKNISSPVAACTSLNHKAGCYSVNFSTHNIPYSRVCGMVVGYQKGSTDGFANFHNPTRSINSPYVDGVSITYGTPRKHLWTYAIGNNDKGNYLPKYPSNCPCSQFPGK